MLTKKTPETISETLKLKSMGETIILPIVYNNVDTNSIDSENAERKENNLPPYTNEELVVRLVKSWESEYQLTVEDLREAEKARPGLLGHIISGFFMARVTTAEKN